MTASSGLASFSRRSFVGESLRNCKSHAAFLSRPLSSTAVASDASSRSTLADTVGSDEKSTATSTPSRWQLLKRARRSAPPPKRRSSYVFDRRETYALPEALSHVRASSWAAFDESVELVFRLNLDPRRAEQNIRGAAELPHGTGAVIRVAVFADEGDAAKQAREAGADLVGGDELVDAVFQSKGKNISDFSACVAVPEIMPRMAAKVGRILGPKGLMPNIKNGTVTGALAEAVAKLKKGQRAFRVDRFGNVHFVAGKLSFRDDQIIDNCASITRAIIAARPETVKKKYMLAVHLCSAMGPSAKVDIDLLTKYVLSPESLPPSQG